MSETKDTKKNPKKTPINQEKDKKANPLDDNKNIGQCKSL